MSKYYIRHLGKLSILAAILIALVLGIGLMKRQTIVAKYVDATKPTPPVPVVVTREEVKVRETMPAAVVKAVLPKTFNLDVPFIRQAPLGVWDHVHEETCEEASVLTVHAYQKHLTLSDTDVERELLSMVELEKKLFGYFEDTNVAKTIEFAKAKYAFSSARVLENPSLDDLKKEIFDGRPVLLPAIGTALNNPNFRNGGPLYHLIVLRGWNEQGFFSNDPGTRKGENYYYTNAVIMGAMRDWNETTLQADGPKRAFVLYE